MGKQILILFNDGDLLKEKPKGKTESQTRINFSQNWNNKLNNNIFSTIRPKSETYKLGAKYVAYLGDLFYCDCNIILIESLSIQEIVDRNYHLTDIGHDKPFFIDLMHSLYGKKKWWKGMETEMNYIIIRKITQLTLF